MIRGSRDGGRRVFSIQITKSLSVEKVGSVVNMPDPKLKNVFEAILKYGHDEDFAPKTDSGFKATQAPAGSREKLDVLADRIRMGYPLWHEEDRSDYTGLTGAVRPRD
jgi:hypothetical protein